jgi:excinuclease ABC subunit C
MDLEQFKEISHSIPQLPGVYRYYDKEDRLLYVGKARNLLKRVSSYFNREHDTARLRLLVRKINRIEYTVVDTEMDALLLENSLIKQHQPIYNIRLKDGKTYPYLCVTNEPYPRLLVTRNRLQAGRYFGPYTSGRTMYAILDFIKANFTLRSCSLALTADAIKAGKFNACLELQIHNCLGPCEDLQSQEEYCEMVEKAVHIIKGNLTEVKNAWTNEMMLHAAALAFEKAERIRQKLQLLDQYQSKSTIVNPNIGQLDILVLTRHEENAIISFMRVEHGIIHTTHHIDLKPQMDESDEDLLLSAFAEIKTMFGMLHREILSNVAFEIEGSSAEVSVPKIGDKRKLVDLALKNGFMELQKLRQTNLKTMKDEKSRKILEQMQRDLNIRQLPRQIECFDNSNFHGDYAVSACVVFVDGKPAKQMYRHFNVKTVEGPNDFATMSEVIHRRYKRQIEENNKLPDLIVVDGGKGQLSAAVHSLKELGIYGKVPILGIAKNLEELFYPEDPYPLLLDKKSITLKIIQQMRDEAHRFGITHHRKRRSKGTIKTALSDIKGVGPKTVEVLLKKYKSIEGIRSVSEADVETLIGKSMAQKVLSALKENEDVKDNSEK